MLIHQSLQQRNSIRHMEEEKAASSSSSSSSLSSLELEHLSLLLLLASELEMLATLDGHLVLALAIGALQTEDDLLGGLGLLSEDGLGLSSVSLLLAIVTPLALGLERVLAFLVLRHLVQRVLSAFGRGAEGTAGLRYVHHFEWIKVLTFYKDLRFL